MDGMANLHVGIPSHQLCKVGPGQSPAVSITAVFEDSLYECTGVRALGLWVLGTLRRSVVLPIQSIGSDPKWRALTKSKE